LLAFVLRIWAQSRAIGRARRLGVSLRGIGCVCLRIRPAVRRTPDPAFGIADGIEHEGDFDGDFLSVFSLSGGHAGVQSIQRRAGSHP
jgi:hypothetical protein